MYEVLTHTLYTPDIPSIVCWIFENLNKTEVFFKEKLKSLFKTGIGMLLLEEIISEKFSLFRFE